MDLSVITDEISQDFEHALDVMADYDVKGAELRCLWGVNAADLDDEAIERARKLVADRGVRVSCIASPFFKCDLFGGEGATGQTHGAKDRGMEDQMALLEKCIRLCEIFDTRFIRVFAFWKKGELTEDIEGRIVEAFREPAARAREAGVILGLENEHACYLGTGVETARVIAAVDSPGLQAVWDPGNAFCSGEVPFPTGYDAMKPYTVHVHVKDAVRDAEGKVHFVCIGDGVLDYPAQLQALKADGYKGYISLETHFKPGGVSEDGSRQCLAALNEMLRDL